MNAKRMLIVPSHVRKRLFWSLVMQTQQRRDRCLWIWSKKELRRDAHFLQNSRMFEKVTREFVIV